MIQRYNRNQIIVGILAIIGGLFCSWLGYLFFRFVPIFALDRFGIEMTSGMGVTIGLLGLAILLSSGYSVWKKGNGLTSFGESALYVESLAKSETGGAYAVNRELGQVTGTSHLLSQIFLAGPLMLLNAATRFASLISSKGDLEKRMGEVLERSRDANKWQDLKEYVGVEEELQNLIRIGAIQYGISRGVPRIKINKNYGN